MTSVTITPGDSLRMRLSAVVRRQPDQVAILVMAVLGIAVSLYLTAEHYAKVPLLCSTNGLVDCASVLTSTYAVVPGTTIPITIPGLLWFGVSGGLAIWGLLSSWRGVAAPSWLRQTQQGWGAIGLLTVLYLVSAEIDHLHHLCAWCTVVHLLVLGTLLVSLYFRTIPKYDRGRTGTTKATTPQRVKPQLSAATAPIVATTRTVVTLGGQRQGAMVRQPGKYAPQRTKAAK